MSAEKKENEGAGKRGREKAWYFNKMVAQIMLRTYVKKVFFQKKI